MMDENVPHRNESIKQRKPVRSIEQISPVCDAYPVPPERNMHSTSQPHPSLPQPPSSLPSQPPAAVSSPNATSSLSMLLSPTQTTMLDEESQMTVKNETPVANVSNPLTANAATTFSLILPQNLSRSFDQTAAQSPPKYQIYHQFSRISSTTQQFIQRQQQQQQQHQQEQQPHQLQRQQSPQTQPASPVTNYQSPLFRKASYGSSHYAHYTNVEPPPTVNAGTVKPTSTHHQHQPSLQCSKPVDQRSNNPFILNFNNISGCCLKNSPTSSSSPSAASPTDRSTASVSNSLGNNTQPVSEGSPSAAITSFVSSGTKRTRSLMLKSTSPLQQTTRSSPSQALASPQGPPVPPRLSHIQSGGSVATANMGNSSSNHPSINPTSLITHCNASTSPGAVTSAIVTGTCYVTPPTPAPLSASDKNQELPSMAFGNVTPAIMSITESTTLVATTSCNKTPTDGNRDGSRNSERIAEIVPNNVRKKRDDFLKTTMKICLVVSPPSKLQMKSLSLTHLDEIERQGTTPTIITNDSHIRKSDNSDTSNTSIASASGSAGYGGNTVSGGSSVHAVSPKDVCVTLTSGSALIDISNSDGGCINPAYDNGDGNHRRETNEGISISDVDARICPKQESMEKAHECQGSGTCCMLTSPSCVKAALSYSSKVSGTSSTSASLKKKSSSFLHRERKKPVLTRSQVSSSEYFSVCFEGDHNDPGVLIPATKGVRLAECLRASLSRKSLSFSQIYVTDNGFNNPHETGIRYTEPLDGNMDISALAGRTLIVSERDATSNRRTGGHLTLQKAASVGNQPSIMSSTSKLFTSTSTDDNYDQSPKASSASGKQSKQKWTIPFGSKGPQKSKLCELLDSYNKEIPKSTSSSSNFNNPEYVDALVGLRNLPQCWTEIVNCAGMSEAETKIQSAIWELVTTEVYYILALQTVTDLFLACLEDIQSQNILTDVDQNKLFSNIRDIWEANLRFWTLYLHPMVKHSQRTREPMSIYYFQRGFVDFATIFTPYTKYCAEQSTCQYYCKEMYHNNPLFMTYCAWCESQKMCNRLRLADILVRPMQRLTKYGLLLAAIKKHINDEAEGEAIDAMIHSVEEFVAGVNSHLTTRQESERLKGINARIDCYEVVDANNEILDRMVKQHSIMFDLCQPMRGIDHGRKVFVEGDLKYKDSTGKMDVHCFLFTDFLLVCKKNKNDKLKIIRQPYMTDRLMVQLKDQAIYCCYVNELNMVVAAFTMQSPKAQHWYDSITKVKHIYNRMKQGTFGDVRQYGNIINISNSCNNSTSNSNMNINNDNLSIKKSPLNSSIGSRVSSLNNSHSGSVDLNESKQVSIDFEKTNSLSSDEGAGVGSTMAGSGLVMMHSKYGAGSARKPKNTVCIMQTKSSNSLTVQPYSGLGQSMPNLNLNSIQNSNTLSVPGTSNSQSHSGMVLLSPSQRGISYPPPSPTRATLRRGFAFSTSIKNPPLIKTRNVSSQQSFMLSQQQSFNSASLGQHQQCLPASSNMPSCSSTNNTGTNAANEGCTGGGGLSLSSANISFFKRKNSFQSVPNNSATTSMDQSLPNET
ncbi:pleckstrin homology domain-containing family G member 5 isoform X2 [Anopheles funestus]|uniref:pleckstrin homology domain-containing family G member 5 isoform X2 n=1 Tax=Anopheles funestus TaxID=62324 RepID=UPI0020C5C89D|nr:pleckstrin homology domain-containing family G member 5 isoform X2 [Anopheles funestus]XP_049294318.1 pleckstrin homology domain-containing family G member 5 isoform X2 [Anopheles funestus]XP_049294319.1 pleckstrin homology domain-containing family G member 5 isoform X2 [Anopheles funestus]XP_049294320.1 pleckstrin homology domain-containing family G member 5 isoform X2 [Anopheles funestus]